MKIVETRQNDYTKLCHASFGDLVRRVDEKCNVLPTIYLVAQDLTRGNVMQHHGGSGLYGSEHAVVLVDVATGDMDRGTHLSSRVVILRDAELHL